MINVLSLVSYNFLPAKMGGQKGIALFNRFLSKEVNLTCITTESNRPGAEDNYDIRNLLSNHSGRYANIFYFFTLRRIIREKKITHLIIEHPYYGWLGILLQRFCQIKLIVHSHNIESTRFKSTGKWWWKLLWWYEKIVYQQADTCFYISNEDKNYSIQQLRVAAAKCHTITYGFEIDTVPSIDVRKTARNFLNGKYGIAEQEKILFFNGTLNYPPNLDALKVILDEINPLLLKAVDFKYRIIVCGKNLPEEMDSLKAYQSKQIIFAGFVEDIQPYFLGADIFLNPVIDGGGIKTKLVEALGYNLNVITTPSGAIGVPTDITGDHMKVVDNYKWEQFATAILQCSPQGDIPNSFFHYFYWGHIAVRARQILTNISTK